MSNRVHTRVQTIWAYFRAEIDERRVRQRELAELDEIDEHEHAEKSEC